MIQKTLIASLTTAALMMIQPVQAQSLRTEHESSKSTYTISPRQLITLANQGRFKAQGIASRNNFRHGVKTGKITAQILIESAIASQRLPAEIRGDRYYLKTVSNHLKSGGCGS